MRFPLWFRSTLLLITTAACRTPSTPETHAGPASTAAVAHGASAGVKHESLATLLEAHWAWFLERSPELATHLGDHRYDDRLSDRSLEQWERDRATRRAFLAAATAIPPESLDDRERTYHALFIETLQNQIASEPCMFARWSLSPRGNPVTTWSYLPKLHRVNNEGDADNLLKRYAAIDTAILQDIQHLEVGIANGWFANAESTRRVIKMVEGLLARPTTEWAMAEPATTRPEALSETAHGSFRAALITTLEREVRPALETYLLVLKQKILPKARTGDRVGIHGLPFGTECYNARIKTFTTLNLTADQIHNTGLREIARINDAMQKLGRKLFGTEFLEDTLAKLRSDESLYFETEEQVEAKAREALRRARVIIPKWFGILPKADCVVVPIPEYEAPFTTVAYYLEPSPDGTKPGEYFINTYKPNTRPRYEAEALAYHEALPGHHLQIAIAQELPSVPAFLKHTGMTAFVEGWALYTEQLSDEMGLYSSDLDRMGMYSYEAWRAARLVVDTGIHAMGWSRERAKAYMATHTALALNNIDNEVDRYIVWPGQALAYKAGQMEIWRLRRQAERALGGAFDIRGFHDAVLSQGAVSLRVLGAQVEAWVQTQRAEASRARRSMRRTSP